MKFHSDPVHAINNDLHTVGHSKEEQRLVFKTDYRLMQVKSIAECSKRAFCNTFNLHQATILPYFEWLLKIGLTIQPNASNSAKSSQVPEILRDFKVVFVSSILERACIPSLPMKFLDRFCKQTLLNKTKHQSGKNSIDQWKELSFLPYQ